MRCPECWSRRVKVLTSRTSEHREVPKTLIRLYGDNCTWRRRECRACAFRWHTIETPILGFAPRPT